MSEQIVAKNKAVFFTYTITDDQRNVMEQSDFPIGYVHGVDSGILEKLEQALAGARVGDQLDVPLTPEDGFGPHDPDLTYTDDLENVPPDFRHVGAEVPMQNERGETKTFIVSRIENGKLTVDGNHPLAGKHIVFHITVTEVRDATPEEIQEGRPAMPTVLH